MLRECSITTDWIDTRNILDILLIDLVLKLFYIEEKKFTERANLVVGRKNLNYSISDVQWHPLEGKLRVWQPNS